MTIAYAACVLHKREVMRSFHVHEYDAYAFGVFESRI